MSCLRAKLTPAVIAATVIAATSAGVLTIASSTSAQAQSAQLEIGRLNCTVVPGSRRNLIITSNAAIDCTFRPTTGPETRYKGETGIGIGLDLSTKTEDRFQFLVFTSKSNPPDFNSYPLKGRYVGAEATVSVVAGVGTKILVGGLRREITLAPIGGQATRGFGASAGAGFLNLEPAN